jgi:tetratricopeptide (TPR) repeat protein
MTPQTRIYHGMALVREGHALLAKGETNLGEKKLQEATGIFAGMRAAGDTSEATALGLALAAFTRYAAWGPAGSPGTKPGDLDEAAALLRPMVRSGKASRQVQLTYADVLNYLSHQQLDKAQAIALCDESRAITAALGARELKDLTAASIYADTADSESRHALQAGRVDDAARLSAEVYDIADGVLLQRPGDLRSMQNRALAASFLASLATRRFDYVQAEHYAKRHQETAENYVRFNPSNLSAWDYVTRAQNQLQAIQFEQGRVQDALRTLRATVELRNDTRLPSSLLPQLGFVLDALARLAARTGDLEAAHDALALGEEASRQGLKDLPMDDPWRPLQPIADRQVRAEVAYLAGRHEEAFRLASGIIAELRKLKVPEKRDTLIGFNILRRQSMGVAALSGLRTGHAADAEALARERLPLPLSPMDPMDPRYDQARSRLVIAHAQFLQGQPVAARASLDEALAILSPIVEQGGQGLTLTREVAYGLYLDALLRPRGDPQRAGKLAEAAQLLRGLGPEAQALSDIRELRGWIEQAG